MLAIRMQRTGRKGHAAFRVVVQDSRQTPTSGKFVALVGSYDPHTKKAQLAKDKAQFYLDHGAQPSDRVARLLKQEGVKLPSWVTLEAKKKGVIRNPDKLRKNRPAGAPEPEPKKDEAEAETETAAPVEVIEMPTTESAESAESASPDKSDEDAQAEPQPETEKAEQ